MDMVHLTEQQLQEFIFTSYFIFVIPTVFAMCQMLEVWPMQKLKDQGWVNTRERKILFYTVRVLFHTIGIIGGVMMANMSVRLLIELAQLITPGFAIVSALVVGISVALYEYKKPIPPTPNRGWKKIVKIDGGTEYHDYDGKVYTIYDMKLNPGFKDAKIK